MPELEGSRTHENLRAAFATESQANRRYLYFAQKADVEGHPELAALFRSVADGETGHAFGHLDFLADVGDPVTGTAIGTTADNLRAAVASESREADELYPGFAATARDEGFEDVAEWFDTLARAERSHATRFAAGLEGLEGLAGLGEQEGGHAPEREQEGANSARSVGETGTEREQPGDVRDGG